MKWTPQQEGALAAVGAWLREPYAQQVFRLFGYAGTGKTTLAKHLAAESGLRVGFAAYTGKAALVLRQRGCEGASTLHSKIYRTRELARLEYEDLKRQLINARLNQEPHHVVREIERELKALQLQLSKPSFKLDPNGKLNDLDLLVIDECSMVDEQMGIDLLSFKKKLLVLGDPAQLPPIRGGGYFTNAQPDVLLTDVQRQARDNPIIELATRVRQGELLLPGDYASSRVISRSEIDLAQVQAADQLLVGFNSTRRASNERLRYAMGRTSIAPVTGDRLVCLRNDHDIKLLNGGQFEAVADSSVEGELVQLSVRDLDGESDFTFDNPLLTQAHLGPFLGEDVALPWWERRAAHEFDYAYALTVHKAQGSQWNAVTILDEWNGNGRRQWLYTAITRAVESVTVVQYD